MTQKTTPVRGTRDYLPDEMEIRDYVQDIILKAYTQNGFQKISTPIMEDIDILNGSDGGENLNLIFKILKRGEKLNLEIPNLTENSLVDTGLRYDLTLPLTRFFSNNQSKLSLPFKCIQIDKVFRAEKPQKGRLREFYQCDIDIIGDPSVDAEIELIQTTAKALLNLGFKDFQIRVNDRRILTDIILAAGFDTSEVQPVCITFDKLDKVGLDGVRDELIEKQFEIETVDKFIDIIKSNTSGDINDIKKFCSESEDENIDNLNYTIDTIRKVSKGDYEIAYDISLVRGMGYYTGMIFEIVSSEFNSSVAGGGRYDCMIGKFLNKDVPAVGFSIGFERIISILSENKDFFVPKEEKVALLYNESDVLSDVLSKANEIREDNYIVSLVKKSKKVGKQLSRLQREGFKYSYNYGSSQELNLLSDKPDIK